jgi:hypothetical protein
MHGINEVEKVSSNAKFSDKTLPQRGKLYG